MQTYKLISALLDTENELEREKLFKEFITLKLDKFLIFETAKAIRERMLPLKLKTQSYDTCGTGGSGKSTINTSTISAFVAAAAGMKIAKHGNRSASGNCGSSDLLESLGININLSLEKESEIFNELGLVFIFAQTHHPVLKKIASLRKKYAKKTVFNIVGPLCNPALAEKQLIGTGNKADSYLLAEALQEFKMYGSKIVFGHDGLDEITVTNKSTILTVDKEIKTEIFDPADLGIPKYSENEIKGSNMEENSKIFLDILSGKGSNAHRDLVLLNTAFILTLQGISLKKALLKAKESLESGQAFNLFQKYKALSNI